MRYRLALPLAALITLAACGSGSNTSNIPLPTSPDDPAPIDSVPADSVPVDSAPADAVPASPATPAPFASTATRSEVDPDAPVGQLTTGFNQAGFNLWQTFPLDSNVVFSPTSIGHALLMARGAADEPTGAAIDAGFSLPDGRSAHEAWNALDQQIQATSATVNIVGQVWPDVSRQPDQEWIDLLASEHGAQSTPLPLRTDPEGSRQIINQAVSDATESRIPELVPAGMIAPNSVLVLTDAIFFEAKWATPFGKYGTSSGEFTALDGSTTPIELMNELELSDQRGQGDGFVGAEIPYMNDDFSMLVIVPDEGRFEEIRNGLDQAFLDDVDASFTVGPYELLLPKWDIEFDTDLFSHLAEMGAAPGNYPALGGELGGAVHAANITVDEQGTIAAAATALEFGDSGPPEPELTVAADQPFMYLIRHRPTGLVLFAGQIVDPADIQ